MTTVKTNLDAIAAPAVPFAPRSSVPRATVQAAIEYLQAVAAAKLDFITVTQAVDLDAIESRVNELDAAVVLKGAWDASAGTFPGAGVAQAGWSYIVSIAGTVDGVAFVVGDRIVCILDNASTSTYASNWLKLDYTDQVSSVAGRMGAVTLTSADLTDVTAYARTLLDDADAAAARTTLELVIGTNVQAYDAELAAIAGLTSAADLAPYFTGPGAAALFALTSFARTLLASASAQSAQVVLGVRKVLTGNVTYYVRTDGNDSNSGLVDSAAGAFLTPQKAIDVVFGTLDLAGFDATIQCRAGAYAGVDVNSPQVGAGRVILLGDTTTPANVTLDALGAWAAVYVKNNAILYIGGIKAEAATGFACWAAEAGGIIRTIANNEVGDAAAHHLAADTGRIFMTNNMRVAGDCPGWHLLAASGGYCYIQAGTWTFVGTVTCSGFAQAGINGVIYAFANSFSGTFNGQRHYASLNGTIMTNSGANPNYFPGTVAGATASGGQFA